MPALAMASPTRESVKPRSFDNGRAVRDLRGLVIDGASA